MSKLPIIGITIGDMNGISVELIIKALSDTRLNEFCVPVVYGSPRNISYWKKLLGFHDFNLFIAKSIDQINYKKSNILVCWEEEVEIKPGVGTEISGTYAFKSLEMAVRDLKSGKINALVTAPLNKNLVNNELLPFKGHTEYLANQDGTGDVLMMMAAESLRIALVTTHLPLKDVASAITTNQIVKNLKVLNDSLIKDFAISKPKIAVLGLNPHAGENGLLGNEEKEIIIPAIKQVNTENNISAFGPFSADGFFASNNFEKFDAILAMYHDQGLIPFKYIAHDQGINFTAGLSFVRTSPAHGTAYDLAGKNTASAESFRNAIYYAIDILAARSLQKELKENPLLFSPIRRERFRIDF